MTLRRYYQEYKSEFFFGILLLAAVVASYYFSQFIPTQLYLNVISPFQRTSLLVICGIGAWSLMKHSEGLRVRKLSAYALSAWTVLLASSMLFEIINYGEPNNPEGFLSPSNWEFVIGDVLEWLLMVYLTEALRHGSGHIGYWIAPQYRGKGFGTEALRLVLEYAENIVPEDEFYLRADKGNAASVRIMEKNGGRIVGEDGGKVFVRIKKPDWSILNNDGARTVRFSDTDAETDKNSMEAFTKHYSRMLTENGEASEGESLAVSRERLTALRNNGEENILRVIEDGTSGETVGYIWYKFVSEEARKFAYTVYIYILEGRRDLGYGTAALKALETLALEKGFNEMRLCVWESNSSAEKLYKRLGYEVYDTEGKKRYLRLNIK